MYLLSLTTAILCNFPHGTVFQIAAIVYSRQSRVSFDTLWLEDLYEKVVLETQGNKITPLVVNPGRILLTSSRLYFQPYNNVESVSWCVNSCCHLLR